jgi:GDPmannose 4,6-dehydratase
LGIGLSFEGSGESEVARISSITGDLAPALSVDDVICKVDSRYFRPAEVETLLGEPSKAKRILGWEPSITVQEMCAEMVREDLKSAQRVVLLNSHGHHVPSSFE